MTLTKEYRAKRSYEILNKESPLEISFLDEKEPFRLLISVIMSAQTTDRQVNDVVKELFTLYPSVKSLAEADKERVKEIIKSTGYYNTKAKNIIETAKRIHLTYNDTVPLKMEELLTLSGVGRKSANVILGQIANLPAIIVDTHFKRVVQRIGLTRSENPVLIEKEVASLLEKEYHYRFSMVINLHGRSICFARKPLCPICPIAPYCESYPIT